MRPEARQEMRTQQRDLDLGALLSTPQGRRLAWRLIEEVGVAFAPSFSLEPLLMAKAEGSRALGLWLMGEAQRVDPDGYLLMLNEALADRKREGMEDKLDAAEKSAEDEQA